MGFVFFVVGLLLLFFFNRFLVKNIIFLTSPRYLSEAHQGTSNEYPKLIFFYKEIKK